MNWGKGIIGGMILFMLFIIGMSIKMFSIPTDDFDQQYYEKGLNFDKDHAREQRVNDEHAQPAITITGGKILFIFTMPVKGRVKFLRPSDKLLDKQFTLDSGPGNEVTIPLDKIGRGQWQLIMEWQSDDKDYLYQQELHIK